MKQDQSKWPAQAFIISREILNAVSQEEVDATFEDMREAGIALPPYDHFDIIVPVSEVVRLVDRKDRPIGMAEDIPGTELRLRFERIQNPKVDVDFAYEWLWTTKKVTLNFKEYVLKEMTRRGRMTPEIEEYQEMMWKVAGLHAYKLLIVLLATRNAIKTTKENKLLKLGIGDKRKNRYTTTISIGRITEVTDPSKPTGLTRRPHLRRGHVRRQHYGPRNELVKQIFIEPVFVNADEGWIAERTAYNLIKEHKREETKEQSSTMETIGDSTGKE